MRICPRKLKNWFKNSAYLGFSVLFVFEGLGCASTHKTTKTETMVTQSNDAGQDAAATAATSNEHQNKGVVEKSATTTTTETKAGHPGILSSTVHAIGWVIALPFRLIGGLLGWIF